MANTRGGVNAVKHDTRIAQTIGIVNSTGLLGMAPFILNHPVLFNNWILAPEVAITRIQQVLKPSISETSLFKELLNRSILSAERCQQVRKIQSLKKIWPYLLHRRSIRI